MTTVRKKLILVVTFLFMITSPCWGSLLFLTVQPPILQWWHSVPFDSEVWKKGDPHDRFDMARDLRRSHGLVGKTKNEIEQLLGNPTMTERRSEQGPLPHFSRDSSVNEIEYWYWMGHEKYHFVGGMDSAFFVIGFENDVAVCIWIGGG